jgi:hypothetical protein
MTDHSLFAITPVTNGHAPDDALVVGPMSEVFEYIPQTVARQDATEQLERARFTADQITSVQEKTRAVQASMLCDSVNHLSSRLDALMQRRDEQTRRDAEREEEEEAQRIQAEIDALPDPDNPDAHTHSPGGELHALSPKGEHDEAEAEFEEPEDPTGTVIPQPAALEFDEV